MHPRQFLAMNAPQTFPVNGHRLRPVAQFLLGPLLERRLESLPTNRLKTRCKVATAGVLLPLKPSLGAKSPCPGPIGEWRTVAVGQHGTDRQG